MAVVPAFAVCKALRCSLSSSDGTCVRLSRLPSFAVDVCHRLSAYAHIPSMVSIVLQSIVVLA